MNWPLYIAPTPGISPRKAASPGLGAPGGGGTNGRCAFAAADHAIQHGSQKIWPAGRLAHALPAQRLAAVLAIRRRIHAAMVYAIHTLLLSRARIAELPDCTLLP